MKYILMLTLFSLSFSASAQSTFSDYKYIVVPKKFETFKKDNQYQTSTLVKHLLSNKGFSVVYEGSFPEDLVFNRCIGVYIKLNNTSSLFTTKVSLSFLDCNSQEVFVTTEGKSKEKDFKKGYAQAITGALNSVDGSHYKYKEKQQNGPMTISFKNDVKSLPKEQKDVKKKVIVQEATEENQSYKDLTPKPSDFKKSNSVTETAIVDSAKDVLYAQEIKEGYKLVDSTPKVRFVLVKTTMPNTFIVKNDTNDGVIYEKNGVWYYDYFVNEKLVSKKLNIKF